MSTQQSDFHAPSWRRGFGQGKGHGSRFHSQLGPVRPTDATARDLLRSRLSTMLIDAALGTTIEDRDADALRHAAIANREDDWDGTALGAMAELTRRGDPAAEAWLQLMLAGAGRYDEAFSLKPGFPPGRPPAPAYGVLVNALALLGRYPAARDLLADLGRRFPGLAEEYVSIWDDTAEGEQYARLTAAAPASKLPTFFHLPFCGGTSIIVSLKQALPWRARFEAGRRFGLYQLERALRLSPTDAASLRLVHLHHPFALQIPGRELDFFTVLRDPVSQLMSGYYKRRESTKIVRTRDDSATFAEHADHTVRAGLTNQLARQLVVTHPELKAAYRRHFRGSGAFHTVGFEEDMFWLRATAEIKPGRLLTMARETLDERFGMVGSMRHLAASHLAAAARIGLPISRRIVHRGRSGRPASELSASATERLRDANWVDQTLFEDYTERFEVDHRELIKAVELVTLAS